MSFDAHNLTFTLPTIRSFGGVIVPAAIRRWIVSLVTPSLRAASVVDKSFIAIQGVSLREGRVKTFQAHPAFSPAFKGGACFPIGCGSQNKMRCCMRSPVEKRALSAGLVPTQHLTAWLQRAAASGLESPLRTLSQNNVAEF